MLVSDLRDRDTALPRQLLLRFLGRIWVRQVRVEILKKVDEIEIQQNLWWQTGCIQVIVCNWSFMFGSQVKSDLI